MRKILLLCLALALPAFALKDTIKSSGKWSALTWSTGTPPTTSDTVYKTAVGTYNDTMDADYTIVAFVSDTLVAGTHWRNGKTLITTGLVKQYSDNGTGTRDYGIKLNLNGTGTVYMSITLGAVTATVCTVSVNNNVTITNPKLVAPYSWIFLKKTQSTLNANYNTVYDHSFIIIGDSAKITMSTMIMRRTGTTGGIISTGINDTIIMPDLTFYVQTSASNNVTWPAFYSTSTAIYNFCGYVANAVGFVLSGTFNAPNVTVIGDMKWSGPYKIDFNGQTTTVKGLTLGNVFGSGTMVNCFGSGTINIGSSGLNLATKNSGSTIDSFCSVNIINAGPVSLGGSAHTSYSGTSTVTQTGSGLITCAGKYFGNLVLNNAGAGTTKNADSTLDSLDMTLTDGRDSLPFSIRCRDWINNNVDSLWMGNLIVSRHWTRNSAYSKRIPGTALYFVNGNDHIMTCVDGGSVGPTVLASTGKKLTAGSNLTLQRLNDSLGSIKMLSYSLQDSTCTIQDTGCQFAASVHTDSLWSLKSFLCNDTTYAKKFIFTPGQTLTVRAGKGFRTDEKLTNGTLGNLCSVQSDTAGKQSNLIVAANDTVSYWSFKDINAINKIYAFDGTNSNLGGNTNIIFFTDPGLDSLRPTHGLAGSSCLAFLSNFISGKDTLYFNAARVSYNDSAGGERIIVPALSRGSYPVWAKDTAHPAHFSDTLTYIIDSVPHATSITLAYGHTAGGETCVLRGYGLLLDSVCFGAAKATMVHVHDSIDTITTPAHATGSVRLYAHRGGYVDSSLQYVYGLKPIIDSIRPIWQKRGAAFKVRGSYFCPTKGTGFLKIGTSVQTQIGLWADTLVIDTIPALWTPKGTFNVIIGNDDNLYDTAQIRILIPTIIIGTP